MLIYRPKVTIIFLFFFLAIMITAGNSSGATCDFSSKYRTIDGTCNNVANPDWGSAGTPLLRLGNASYKKGWIPPERPNARIISNTVSAQQGPNPISVPVTDMLWQFGQFLDHDIDLTLTDPGDPFPIEVDDDDEFFQFDIPFERSIYVGNKNSGDPRQQINTITSYIDASNVYGSDTDTALSLREKIKNEYSCKLITSKKNLLPRDELGLFFLAGDLRANEQVGLTAFHTLFMREHNRVCDEMDSNLSEEEKYQRARAYVGALMQVITYQEFLPLIIGAEELGPYEGYDPSVNAGIINEFSTAAYRFGHTMLPSFILCLKENGQDADGCPLALQDAFFAPDTFKDIGIDPIIRGLANGRPNEVDTFLVDDIRNFLFANIGIGLDLASLNMQRGRDHGLPSYNGMRKTLGLPVAKAWSEITSDKDLQEKLKLAYQDDIDKVDIWTGGLAEDHVSGAIVGELFREIIKRQFNNLRHGDRFYYKNHLGVFSPEQINELEKTTLADIIKRNTSIKNIQDNVFGSLE